MRRTGRLRGPGRAGVRDPRYGRGCVAMYKADHDMIDWVCEVASASGHGSVAWAAREAVFARIEVLTGERRPGAEVAVVENVTLVCSREQAIWINERLDRLGLDLRDAIADGLDDLGRRFGVGPLGGGSGKGGVE